MTEYFSQNRIWPITRMLGYHDKVLNVPMLGDQTFMAITSVTQAQSYSIHSGHLTFTCLQNAKNRFQIFTSWVLKYLSFRVVYFQFMALLFLHLHLSLWLRYMIFFVCVYTFSVDTWECVNVCQNCFLFLLSVISLSS